MIPTSQPTRTHSRLVHSQLLNAGLACTMLAVLPSCTPPQGDSSTERAWNEANNPQILKGRKDLERRFSKLPDEGKVKSSRRPWLSTYWPSQLGGLSARWNSQSYVGFWTRPPGFQSLKSMSLQEKATLSPAEKYDIYMGNYSYPLTQYEKSRTHPLDLNWEGLGHGVAAASLVFPEPKPVLAKNPTGIEVPFGSADLKGLLALYMGYVASNDVHFVGERCNRFVASHSNTNDVLVNLGPGMGRETLAECEDVNAGTFHVLLTNWIGRQRESIIADSSRGGEVWNFPILEYSSRVLSTQGPGPKSAPGTVRENVVETLVHFAAHARPAWREKEGLVENSIEKHIYRYTVELNKNGEIIGGEWLVNDFPDFLWRQGKPQFDFYFQKLGDLVELSQNSDWDQDLSFRM